MSLGSPSYHPSVRVATEGHVTTVIIDNPAAKNACTGDMWVALGATFRDLSYSGARAIVLTGAGGDFCAGADLACGGGGGSHSTSGHILDGDAGSGRRRACRPRLPGAGDRQGRRGVRRSGLGLALAADMIWCSDRARFSAIFAKRGLSLDFGTSWLLRQRIGVHRAKEIALTGKMLTAAEALALGLVNAVMPVHELDRATREIVDAVAAGPPVALSMAKRELDNAAHASLGQALEAEALAQSINVQTDDLKEAMLAYAERRPPNFSGHRTAMDRARGFRGLAGGTRQPGATPGRVAGHGRRRAAAKSTDSGQARRPGPDRPPARPRVLHGDRHPGGRSRRPGRRRRHRLGAVDGRPVMVAAEDFTVLAGTISSAANAKRYRVAELAATDRVPLVMMLEGAGFRADGKAHARIAHRSAGPGPLLGRVPLVTAILGASAGHGALVAPISDFTVMSAQASVFTAGPPVVLESLGRADHQGGSGGPDVAVASGLVHNVASDDLAALDLVRAYLALLPLVGLVVPDRCSRVATTGFRPVPELLDIMPRNGRRVYDMHEVIDVVFDEGSCFEVQPDFGRSLICSLARLGGHPVAVVANQP